MTKKFNDKEYWENYYEKVLGTNKISSPSPFAKYLIENDYIKPNNSIIELGCGNGRDSMFFAKQNCNVTAVDQCNNTTSFLNSIQNIHSFPYDFTRLNKLENKVNVVYSRFTLHSIDDKAEERTIKWAFDNIEKDGLFCIEARTINDPIFGLGEDKGDNVWFYNNHHRRFLVAEIFKNKIEKSGFEIILFKESNDFAVSGDNNPIVMRLIVKLK